MAAKETRLFRLLQVRAVRLFLVTDRYCDQPHHRGPIPLLLDVPSVRLPLRDQKCRVQEYRALLAVSEPNRRVSLDEQWRRAVPD